MKHRLTDVRQVFSNKVAFTAVKGDGRIICWGDAECGGDCSAIHEDLTEMDAAPILTIYSSPYAFAAQRADGSLLTWGDPDSGGDSTRVCEALQSSRVERVFSTDDAFAAISSGERQLITWGDPASGGDSSSVRSCSSVVNVAATRSSFAALKQDGTVSCWGDPLSGGKAAQEVQDQLVGVTKLQATRAAFAALKQDGSVVCWGDAKHGANVKSVASIISSGVKDIFAMCLELQSQSL